MRSRARTRTGVGLGLVAALALGASVAPAAAADPDGPRLSASAFDGGGTSGERRARLELMYTGPASDVAGATVSENGRTVRLDGPPAKLTGDRGVVFVIDSGPGMDDANLLPEVRDTIRRTATARSGMEYAVVQAGDQADIRADFTREPARLDVALASIGPTKGSSVWNAVSLASSMFDERPRLQPNIVVITADDDTNGAAGAPVARAAAVANAVRPQLVVYGGSRTAITDTGPYEELARADGQDLTVRSDRPTFVDALAASVDAVGDQQWTLSWRSTVADGEPLHLDIDVGGTTQALDVLAGRGRYEGHQQLHPELGSTPATLPFTDSKLALAVALLLVLGAVAAAVYAVGAVLVRGDLSNVLSPYAGAFGRGDGGDGGDRSSIAIANTALMKKAVAITEQVAERRGLLTRAEVGLERANLPLRAGEALFFYAVGVVALTLGPLVLTRNVGVALIGGVLAALVPVSAINVIARRRRRAFASQLPDTLTLLAGTLTAGYSLMQGVEAVSREVDEPMGQELRRVVTEARLGRSLEESLDASADRMGSPDFSWAVMAIAIQREVGGNLSELLTTVSDTMVARERLRRDVASLTAEGRVSSYMLAGMPPTLAVVLYVMNREYVSTLFTNTIGLFMVGAAVTSMIIGFLWMRKIITIEI